MEIFNDSMNPYERIAELEQQELGFIQTLCSQSEEIGRLKAKNQQLREAIQAHNDECDALCLKDCIYRTTYTKTKCPNCAQDWKIDAALLEGEE